MYWQDIRVKRVQYIKKTKILHTLLITVMSDYCYLHFYCLYSLLLSKIEKKKLK